jgi:hypothetical protein
MYLLGVVQIKKKALISWKLFVISNLLYGVKMTRPRLHYIEPIELAIDMFVSTFTCEGCNANFISP